MSAGRFARAGGHAIHPGLEQQCAVDREEADVRPRPFAGDQSRARRKNRHGEIAWFSWWQRIGRVAAFPRDGLPIRGPSRIGAGRGAAAQ
jgi:hypothetical protein